MPPPWGCPGGIDDVAVNLARFFGGLGSAPEQAGERMRAGRQRRSGPAKVKKCVSCFLLESGGKSAARSLKKFKIPGACREN